MRSCSCSSRVAVRVLVFCRGAARRIQSGQQQVVGLGTPGFETAQSSTAIDRRARRRSAAGRKNASLHHDESARELRPSLHDAVFRPPFSHGQHLLMPGREWPAPKGVNATVPSSASAIA